jgi:hypothetical protein
MKSSFRIILLSLTAPVFLIGYLTSPSTDPESHWIAVGWIIFLILVNWRLSSLLIYEKGDKSIFGVLPAAGLVITTASIASSLLLLLASRTFSIQETWHLISQILIIFGTIFLIASLNLTKHLASNVVSEGHFEKNAAIKKINSLQLETKNESCDQIISIIKFDFPHDTKLQNDTEWISFSKQVQDTIEASPELLASWLHQVMRIRNKYEM